MLIVNYHIRSRRHPTAIKQWNYCFEWLTSIARSARRDWLRVHRFGTLHINTIQAGLVHLPVKLQLTIVFLHFCLTPFSFVTYYSFIVQCLAIEHIFFFHEAFGYLLWNLFHFSIYLILIVVSCVKCDCFSTQHDNCRRIKKTTKCETSNCTRLTFHQRAIVSRRCVIIFH